MKKRIWKILITVIVLTMIMESTKVSAKKREAKSVEQILQSTTDAIKKIAKVIKQLDEDVKYMAEIIYHENWYTDKKHRAAYLTGAVVNNRRKSKDKSLHSTGDGSVKDVLYAKGQYSTTHKFFTEKIPQECYDMAMDIVLNGTSDVPENVIYQARFKQGSGKYDIINGEWFCYE